MAHAVETMAYANQVPWHGLGANVNPSIGVDEMLVQAGLDWEVSQHPLYTNYNGKKIETDKLALIRDKDQKVLTVTSKQWKPLQNRDAMEFFREYTEAGGATLETAGSLKGGKIVWALASLHFGFTLPDGDQTNGYLLLTSPHEIGRSIQVRTTSVRVVCANTMSMAMHGSAASGYRQTHSKEFDFEAAHNVVQMSKEAIENAEIEALKLQATKMGPADALVFFNDLISPEALEIAEAKMMLEGDSNIKGRLAGLFDSYNNGKGANQTNAWGVLNAVTHYADHSAGRLQDNRLINSWFGHMRDMKITANTKLLEMAS